MRQRSQYPTAPGAKNIQYGNIGKNILSSSADMTSARRTNRDGLIVLWTKCGKRGTRGPSWKRFHHFDFELKIKWIIGDANELIHADNYTHFSLLLSLNRNMKSSVHSNGRQIALFVFPSLAASWFSFVCASQPKQKHARACTASPTPMTALQMFVCSDDLIACTPSWNARKTDL